MPWDVVFYKAATSTAMCRRRPTGRLRTPCPMLCDEGLPKSSYTSGVWYKLWPILMKLPVMQGASPARTPSQHMPSASQEAIVMSEVMSEKVAKLIAILATSSRTGHNWASFDFSGIAV